MYNYPKYSLPSKLTPHPFLIPGGTISPNNPSSTGIGAVLSSGELWTSSRNNPTISRPASDKGGGGFEFWYNCSVDVGRYNCAWDGYAICSVRTELWVLWTMPGVQRGKVTVWWQCWPSYVVITIEGSSDERSTRFFTAHLLFVHR